MIFTLHLYSTIGWIVVTTLLLILWIATGILGKYVFKRLKRNYHLIVIAYWLDRLEKQGTHCFQKPDDEAQP